MELKMPSPWPRNWPLKTLAFLWVLPNNILAMLLVLLGLMTLRGANHRLRAGALEVVCMKRWPGTYMRNNNWGGFTLGSVVWLWFSDENRNVGYHERVHVKQNLKFGILWPILYLLYLPFTGYLGNPFEVDARAETAKWQLT